MMLIYVALAALCSVGGIPLKDAKRLAIAAAPALTAEARARGSRPIITWTEKTALGWAFRIGATNPCTPGLNVCSSLVGHYSVDATTLRVEDDDLEHEVSSAKLRKLVTSLRNADCARTGRRIGTSD